MDTNYTNKGKSFEKLIYKDLSYILTGICFDTHNMIGRLAREKQYSDMIEEKFKEIGLPYKREFRIGDTGNVVDFLVDKKIVLEIKAKRLILKEDFYQTQRYLQITNLPLALLVNFRNRFLKPIRIVKIETDVRKKIQ